MGDACGGVWGLQAGPRQRGMALGRGLAATDGAVWAAGWLSRQEMRLICAQAAKVQQGKPGLTRFALFSGANKRPRKRLYRTVLRAWPLSNQERNQGLFSRRRSLARAGPSACSSRRRARANRHARPHGPTQARHRALPAAAPRARPRAAALWWARGPWAGR